MRSLGPGEVPVWECHAHRGDSLHTDPDRPWDPDRARALREASTRNQGGSLGAEIYRSLSEPTQMMRITKWNDLADRERWHATEEYQRLVPISGGVPNGSRRALGTSSDSLG